MDLLKRELQKKRKAATQDFAGKSFVRRSELDQKQIQKRRPKASPLAPLASSSLEPAAASGSDPSGGNPSAAAAGDPSTSSSDELGLPRHEVIRRLRLLREPATMFGEGDAARVDRLKHALRSSAIDDSGDFLGDTTDETRKRHKAAGTRDAEHRVGGGADDGDVGRSGDDDADAVKDSNSTMMMEAKFDELCKEDKILVFFTRLLGEWKQQLDGMPELEKRTANGKMKVARFNQSAQYLAPLFEFCRKKILPDDIRQALLEIVECCMRHDYLLAEEHYIKLAIGNAAWPIGVTMVGIHERSAREKISTNSIAHIMNDETTRRYLQSIKRLMTLCEPRSLTLP